MKDILKIVITGGPCAGKTTALEKIAEFLRGEGYSVIFCHETATELITDGVRPFGNDNDRLPLFDFQRLILDCQLADEDIRIDAAKHAPNNKVAILFDRGILDNRAYITYEQFQELIDKKGMTEEEILERYDLVIHLVSTAVDKEWIYEGTATRQEDIEEAKALDERTMRTWARHKRHPVIYNNCSFNGKIALVVDEIKKYLGIKRDLTTTRYIIERYLQKEPQIIEEGPVLRLKR